MLVDGSSTPVNFDCACPADRSTLEVEHVMVVMSGSSLRLDRFGSISTLTNGLQLLAIGPWGNTEVDFLDGSAIRDWEDWGLLGETSAPVVAALGTDTLMARWRLSSSGRSPVLPTGACLRIRVRDNLSSGISSLRAMAQGVFGPTVA